MNLPFSYYNSKAEAAFLLALILLSTAMFCRLLVDVMRQAEGSAWLCVPIFGLLLGVFIWLVAKMVRRLFDKSPRLTLTQTGVTDHTLGIGEIHWTDIKGAYARSAKYSTFICLNLRNEHEYIARMSPTTRSLHSVNNKLGFTAVVLALNGVDANTNELLATINTLTAQIN